jgi:hypothetical protein
MGMITMAVYAAMRLRFLAKRGEPRYIRPSTDYSRFREPVE